MGFEFNAEQYEKASNHQQEWGRTLIDGLSFRGNERVLDLGCGDGRLTAMLADQVPDGKVLGIDASRRMINRARQRETANLNFSVTDIRDMSGLGDFDMIFSNAALHWITDHYRLWKDIDGILMSGASVRFSFAGKGNSANFIEAVRAVMSHSNFSSLFDDFVWPWYNPSVEEYRELTEGMGFSRMTVWGENRDRYFPDRDALVGWIDQPCLVPFLEHLDKDTGASFRDRVVDLTVEKTSCPDGRYFEKFERINIYAEK